VVSYLPHRRLEHAAAPGGTASTGASLAWAQPDL